jgi:hypothetical protein
LHDALAGRRGAAVFQENPKGFIRQKAYKEIKSKMRRMTRK